MLSYKYRLKPTKEQIRVLEAQLRICRWTYNTLLDHCYEEREAGRGTPTSVKLLYLLPIVRTSNPELNTLHSQVLQNIAKRVRSGFECHWVKKRLSMKTHLPRFRSADRYNSLTYPQSGFNVKNGLLRLSKIGDLKIIQHRPIEGEVKTLTIGRESSGKWYAVFSCEVENKPISDRLPSVGVDFGLYSLVALSDGTVIEAQECYRKVQVRKRRLDRRHSKCRKGSENREKARIRAAVVTTRVANQRKDFAFKVARSIVDKYERIYVENLKITNMVRNKHLSKSIYDAGWGMLRNALTYMAKMSEGVMAFVNPRNTSQLCS